MEKIVYYCNSMSVFGDRMVRDMGYTRYDPDKHMDERVIFLGIYFGGDFNALMNHRGERVVYWNGSDLLRTLQSPKWLRSIYEGDMEHLCQSEWMVEVLRRVGVKAHWHPLFFGDPDKFTVSYKQSDTPSVYITSHPDRDEEYGLDVVERVAPSMPRTTFHVYGVEKDNTDNVIYHGWVDEDKMNEEVKDFQAVVKGPVVGISQTTMKAILRGQYVISLSNEPGLWYAKDDKGFKMFLKKLPDMKEPNREAIDVYGKYFNQSL